MSENKLDKQALYDDFDNLSDLPKEEIIAKVISRYDLTKDDAMNYYEDWKKEFMKEGHPVPNAAYTPRTITNKPKKVTKNISVAKKESTKTSKEPIIITKNKDVEKALEKGFEEIMKESQKSIDFIPVVFKGKYFEYENTKEALIIRHGCEKITKECIAEQQEALEIWEKYKELV